CRATLRHAFGWPAGPPPDPAPRAGRRHAPPARRADGQPRSGVGRGIAGRARDVRRDRRRRDARSVVHARLRSLPRVPRQRSCARVPPMDIGVTIFLTDKSIGVVELARALEERGFESLFVPEHTHIPTSRRTPYPAGEPLPDEYRRTFDPFVALTAAAAATERIKLGTGICLVAQHHPINAAKATASIDLVSNGRFVFGVGFGWNQDEMEDHGVEPKRRRAQCREHVLAIKSLWQDEEASFDGEFVHLPPSWSWPKPVQRPH